jgi:molybdenum cofactor cytidylyltransferase
MKKLNITAIVLAAGLSSRMGGFKPLMSLGDTTIIEHIVRMFRTAGILDIRVVIGFRASDVSSVLKPLNVRPVLNESYSEGMFSSIKVGIESLESDCEAFFVLPTDIPLVRPETVNALLGGYRPRHILYPVFKKRRGHPPLISTIFTRKILNFSGQEGLQSVLKQNESSAVNVAVADEGVLLDMDTQQEYRRILARFRQCHIPTPEECMALMNETFRAEKEITDHGQVVAKMAMTLGKASKIAGADLDLDLIFAAGLLHDIARKQADHARIAEQILSKLGYSAVADIVGSHMDITIEDRKAINEKEVVFLADKLVRGSRIVDLESRFKTKMKQYASDPDVLSIIRGRLESALKIKHRLEHLTGKSLESMIKRSPPEQPDGNRSQVPGSEVQGWTKN